MDVTEELQEIIQHCEYGTTAADLNAMQQRIAKLAAIVLQLVQERGATQPA